MNSMNFIFYLVKEDQEDGRRGGTTGGKGIKNSLSLFSS